MESTKGDSVSFRTTKRYLTVDVLIGAYTAWVGVLFPLAAPGRISSSWRG